MERIDFDVKPAVGFTLPSAGVTPAPGERNREMSRTTFRSQGLMGDLSATGSPSHFFERAMEALVLALGLRMVRTAVGDADPEPNQPQTKAGERLRAGRAPRRAVVHQHRGRQAVAAKSLGQHQAHGLLALVGAGLKHQREARVIVEHSQRMAAEGCANRGEVPLEVHLPEFVGCRALKALKGVRRRRSPVEQTAAAQDAGDSARRQLWAALDNQPSRQLASASWEGVRG